VLRRKTFSNILAKKGRGRQARGVSCRSGERKKSLKKKAEQKTRKQAFQSKITVHCQILEKKGGSSSISDASTRQSAAKRKFARWMFQRAVVGICRSWRNLRKRICRVRPTASQGEGMKTSFSVGRNFGLLKGEKTAENTICFGAVNCFKASTAREKTAAEMTSGTHLGRRIGKTHWKGI